MTTVPVQPLAAIVVPLAALAAGMLVLPFLSRRIEENLEPFFLAAGLLSLTFSGLWSRPVVIEALKAPIMIGGFPIGIVQVVLVMGLLTHFANAPFSRWILRLAKKLGHHLFIFIWISALGLLASVISVIVAAGRLNIRMKGWATVGVPIGLAMMAVYFAVLFVF